MIAYYIDGRPYYTYDTVKFNEALKRVRPKNLKALYYSRAKMDNQVPGKGENGILIIRQLDLEKIKSLLKDAKRSYVDNSTSSSGHTIKNSKYAVLLIDKIIIPATEARSVIEKFDPNIIYDIDLKTIQIPVTIYGQNAKNGLVEI